MAVTGKAGVERDSAVVVVAVGSGIESLRRALAQHVVVDRRAGDPAKHMAQMKRRQISDPAELRDAPFAGGVDRDRLLDARDARRIPRACALKSGSVCLRGPSRRSDISRRSSPSVSISNRSGASPSSRARSRLRSIMALAGSTPCDANDWLPPAGQVVRAPMSSSNRKISARSPIAPGKPIRDGVSAAINTAWLGVPMT